MATAFDPLAPGMTTPEEAKSGKWNRTFTVACDSPEQKAAMQAAAKRAGMNLTRFVIRRVLLDDQEILRWKERTEAASEKLTTAQVEQARLQAENEGLRRRVSDLEARVSAGLAGRHTAAARGSMNLRPLGPRILRLLRGARMGAQQVPVPSREIVAEILSDRDLDGWEWNALCGFLDELARWGVIERIHAEGKTAYRWTAIP